MTDSLGNILKEESRFPYGLERNVSDNTVTADYVYTGKESDEETGLIYFGGRYYAPELGRWITPDPLFLEDVGEVAKNWLSSNLYAFVRNSPVTLVDPDGHRESWGRTPDLRSAKPSNAVERAYVGALLEAVPQLVTALTPGLNDLRDVYELGTGRDLIRGTKLSLYERALAGVGLVIGSGAAYRHISNAPSTTRTFRHYGYADDAAKFEGGLRPGSYATHARGRPMHGTTAQQKLALPHEAQPNAYYKVRVGPDVPVNGPRPVQSTQVPVRPGGGMEYTFPKGTPRGSVEGPFPIP